MTKTKCALRYLDDHFEESILIVLLLIITLLTGMQVVMRYLLHNPLSWSEELCRYCYMWTGFFSIAYCVRKRAAIRINTMLLLLSHRKQKCLEILANIISSVLYGAFAFTTIAIIQKTIVTGQASPAMRIPFYIIYVGPFLGFGLALIRLIQVIVEDAWDVFTWTGDAPAELPQAQEAREYVQETKRGGE
jgi:TRAP-type C4-dicarboxylate transport system permease small subunit